MRLFALLFSIFSFVAVVYMTSAHAASTMDLVDEYRDGNHKVCVYSDGRNTETVEKSYGGSCPSKKFFY